MPNQTNSKRISISLNPELYAVVSDLAHFQNKPMSQVVVGILEEMHPMLEMVRDGLKEVKEGTDPKAVLKKFVSDLILDGSEHLGELSKEVKKL
jgi:predicted DNA-binding protein